MPRRLAHTLPTKADEGSGVGCVWVIVDRISKSGGGVAAVNAYNAMRKTQKLGSSLLDVWECYVIGGNSFDGVALAIGVVL